MNVYTQMPLFIQADKLDNDTETPITIPRSS
jgi:hypothetical protein